jgi:hypothetical protein
MESPKAFKKRTFNFPIALELPILRRALKLFWKKENQSFNSL